ncbi:MAG: magnesium chelatase, partial [Lachnospiraceae bacterium]|nr:magnesium chelatase [Lachnospiraceae bacterium]
MYSSVCSGGLCGLKSYISSVEIDVSKSLPSFDMVGRLSNEVKEAKERIKVALKNCGIELPPVKITVNISPAD